MSVRWTPKRRYLQYRGEAEREAVPKREQFLDHDSFYPCQVCGDLWPKKRLRRLRIPPRLVVCPNDYDTPTVDDYRRNPSGTKSMRTWWSKVKTTETKW